MRFGVINVRLWVYRILVQLKVCGIYGFEVFWGLVFEGFVVCARVKYHVV